jgi:galactokinase
MPSDAAFSKSSRPRAVPASPGADGAAEARAREADAHRLLNQSFGARDAEARSGVVAGIVDVQSAQTHYSNGFALLMPLPGVVAVACRPSASESTHLAYAGTDAPRTVTVPDSPDAADADLAPWDVVLDRVLSRYRDWEESDSAEWLRGGGVEVAVVSSVPPACLDGYLAALAVATARALQMLGPAAEARMGVPTDRDDVLPALRLDVKAGTRRPTGVADLIAAYTGGDPFTLIDTARREHLPVETRGREVLGWAVIDTGDPSPRDAAWHQRRHDQAEKALSLLRERGFGDLRSFRNLEHRRLDDAVDRLPANLKPIARHLVSENRRVQKHVAALRSGDWQMVGALLLMSHASLRDRWQSTSPAADRIVAAVEQMTLDGVYGACMSARDGAVLVTGRPSALDRHLAAIAAEAGPNARIMRL